MLKRYYSLKLIISIKKKLAYRIAVFITFPFRSCGFGDTRLLPGRGSFALFKYVRANELILVSASFAATFRSGTTIATS